LLQKKRIMLRRSRIAGSRATPDGEKAPRFVRRCAILPQGSANTVIRGADA
jgi:hypothetical protein